MTTSQSDGDRPILEYRTDAFHLAVDSILAGQKVSNCQIPSLHDLMAHVLGRLGTDHPNARLFLSGCDIRDGHLNGMTVSIPFAICGGTLHAFHINKCHFKHGLLLQSVHIADALSFESTEFIGNTDVDSCAAAYISLKHCIFESFFRGTRLSVTRHAHLEDCTFKKITDFTYCSFGDHVDVINIVANDAVFFSDSAFKASMSIVDSILDSGASFTKCSFGGAIGFRNVRGLEKCRFGEAVFGDRLGGDWRLADIRDARTAGSEVSTISDPATNTLERQAHPTGDTREQDAQASRRIFQRAASHVRLNARRLSDWYLSAGWEDVRKIGQLQILNKGSIAALVLAPLAVAVWPAVVWAHSLYQQALLSTLEQLASLTESIQRYTTAQQDQEADLQQLDSLSEHLRLIAEGLSMHDLSFSLSLKLLYFSAIATTIAYAVYQIHSPDEVKKHDADSFVEQMHARYPESAPDREAGVRRAMDNILAASKSKPDLHPNLIRHHGEMVWVPPRNHPEFIDDIEFNSPYVEGKAEHTRHPDTAPAHYLPAAERRRIIIEAGAREEYWLKSQEKSGWAKVALTAYMLGGLLLATVILIQAYRVAFA